MYTEYNSQNMNQNYYQDYKQNNNNQNYNQDNDNNGKDTITNKIFGVIWKILLVILILILLFLALIQFGVISLSSEVAPDVIVLNVNEIGIKKGRGYQLISTVLPENASNKQIKYESSDPKIASVNEVSGYIKALKVGTATIKAKTMINDRETECLVTVEDDGVTVQSISLNNKNISLAVGYTYGLSYRITPSNATELGAKFYSSDTSVATVDSKGLVRGVREGTAIITVSANNNTITDTAYVTVYKKGTVTTTTEGETVKTNNYPKSISLSSQSLNLAMGTNSQLQPTITPSNSVATLTWKSSNPSVATVNENGLVTAVGVGKAEIVVSTINNHTAICTVNVGNYSVGVKKINITTNYAYLNVGGTYPLFVEFTPSDATNRTITWSSSNPSVASVSSSGVVKGLASGSAIITAKSKDGGKTATTTIEVGGGGNIIEVKSISFAKAKYDVGLNSTISLSSAISYNPTNASYKSVSYTSSNTNVATVDNSGLVKGVGIGTATITATIKQGTVSTSTTINVKNISATSVSLDKTSITLSPSQIENLSVSVNPANASDKTVTYMSSNPNVATVDKNGTIKAIGIGTANITVTPNGGGSPSICVVTVK